MFRLLQAAQCYTFVFATLVMTCTFGSVTAVAQTVNMSKDLVRLGIASQNLTPNTPTLDARPLIQAAIEYTRNHAITTLSVD